jgi:hypothetical protein
MQLANHAAWWDAQGGTQHSIVCTNLMHKADALAHDSRAWCWMHRAQQQ